ncbi:hypothetical protein M3J09_003660 [Ascochyta lentis]
MTLVPRTTIHLARGKVCMDASSRTAYSSPLLDIHAFKRYPSKDSKDHALRRRRYLVSYAPCINPSKSCRLPAFSLRVGAGTTPHHACL